MVSDFIKFIFRYISFSIALLTSFRLAFLLWQSDHLDNFSDVFNVLLGGFRIDLSLLSYLVLLPVLAMLLVTLLRKQSMDVCQVWIKRWCWVWLLLMVFMESVTPIFINEYGTRPNRLFFEYLNRPQEIVGMVIHGYLLVTIVISVWLVMFAYWAWRKFLLQKSYDIADVSMTHFMLLVLLIPVLVLAGRSGLQHRPINASMVAFSHDDLLNKLSLNSTYSVLNAIYAMKNESNAAKQYGKMPIDDMMAELKAEVGDGFRFDLDGLSDLADQNKTPTGESSKDLLIVVEESLGAQFVGSLGGVGVTPYIDSWHERSWFFERLYATGTRSARGLEALVTGFPPSPARSVLKLPKAQSDFFTLAALLSEQGYHNTFIYGGESHFDNMKGFFLANGFDQVIDQNDYESPSFKGTWGVSDEDLFGKAKTHITRTTNQPQFTLVFSSSNHTPFEFPVGRIENHDKEKATVNNAVKYADYALGNFLNELEHEQYLSKAVVLVVADHDARVKGEQLVPVERFHIPGFIIGSDVKVQRDNRLVSQIDLAPTLLSLIGVEAPHPMLGFDLTQSVTSKHRALMQYGDNFAYMNDDELVVLQPEKSPLCFAGASINAQVVTCQNHKKALAYVQFSSWAYEHQKYHLL